MDDVKRKKFIYYYISYMCTLTHLVLIITLYFNLKSNKKLIIPLLIWGIPALISFIISIFIKNNYFDEDYGKYMLKLALANLLSFVGLICAIIYLFI